MPVAFRSVGARLKADVTMTSGKHNVALPPGHVSGDLLLLVIVTDDNTGPLSTPLGWTLLTGGGPGLSGGNTARVRTWVYRRMDNGSLGSTVPVSFSTSPWPAGSPYVLAFTAAYTGCDPSAPIERWTAIAPLDATAATQAHPQITTRVADDWLVTIRTGSAWGARTVTNSVAADVERVDDNDGFGELFAALYDSAAGLPLGTQTQRFTTSAGGDAVCQGGSTMWSLALKPVTTTAYALPGTPRVAAQAFNAAVHSEPGGWDLCGVQGLPRYRFVIDWDADGIPGSLSEVGDLYVRDTFQRSATAGWGTADTGQTWTVGATASDFSVTGGSGVHLVGSRSASRFSVAPSPSADVDLRVDFTTDQAPAGDSFYVYALTRYTDGNNSYAARAWLRPDGSAVLSLRKRVGGTETQLAATTAEMTYTAGTRYTLRTRVAGDQVMAKIWKAGTTEPQTWPVRVTDTGLTAAGSVGVRSLIGAAATNTLPVTFSYSDFAVYAPTDPEDVTAEIVSDISVSYGRDQERQLGPAVVGSAAFTLDNSTRRYSPDNALSPLSGDLDPARTMSASVDFNGQRYPLFRGRIDDYTVQADFGDRTADFTFLDGLNDLAGIKLSTGVYTSMRTGDLINLVLDLAGWTGGRDIDRGASVVRYWWLEDTDALSAINDLVKSEGPPALAYVSPGGVFTFRDRHHRLQRPQSLTPRAVFSAGRLADCSTTAPAVPGYSFTKPFVYSHGWRDIVNSVTFDVEEREPAAVPEVVWTDNSTYTLTQGQSVDVEVRASEPFVGALPPVPGVDLIYDNLSSGWVQTVLSRNSGVSATLTLKCLGRSVTVTKLQLRARPLTVARTVRVSLTDPGSVTRHGERAYPDSAPWANPADAEAIASMILRHYGRRRPTVQLRIVSQDPAHFTQVLQRTVSDRIRIVNGEMGLDSDFFVERVTHTVQRLGRTGRPPVHAVVLGCEQDWAAPSNAFRFDQRGAGFDQGVFDLTTADDPGEVFTFDDPVRGQFDRGRLGT
jgi:hypothetical protein